jgi:site-specific DNA-methyltransferase (cytosine-N4-specific)
MIKKTDKRSNRSKHPSVLARIKDAEIPVQYHTRLGVSVVGETDALLRSGKLDSLVNSIQLIFTSPPFPLNRKKKYGNFTGATYKSWLKKFAVPLSELLTQDGSIVVEMGNAWEQGLPVMSTLALETLLAFKKAAKLELCQEFIWYNPARLPTPAQWVTIQRVRVKDAFTRLWWLSKTAQPYADNSNVLVPYSGAMKALLRRKTYNAGTRPSGHVINATSFLRKNSGAIPPNVLTEIWAENVLIGANTDNTDSYQQYCKSKNLAPHPARMPSTLPAFFIKLCTRPADLVFDPFGGSNTTGATAEQLGRRWLTIERQEDYAAAGIGRFPDLTGIGPLIPKVLSHERRKISGGTAPHR